MDAKHYIVGGLVVLSIVGYLFKLYGDTKVREQLFRSTTIDGSKRKRKYTDKERNEFYRSFNQWGDVNVQHSSTDNSQVWVFENTREDAIYPMGHRIVATSHWDLIEGLMLFHDEFMESL